MIWLLTLFSVWAAEPKSVQCKAADDVRVIEIEPAETTGCKLFYTKKGKRSEIGSHRTETAYCQTIAAQVRSTLETAGFSCK